MKDRQIEQAYALAKHSYQRLGVDADAALKELAGVPLSLPCWQLDDVRGFEENAAELSGGLAATGSHAGAARNAAEMRADLEKALSLLPGKHRLNLHAIYGEFGGAKVDRDAVGAAHFAGWMDWAKAQGVKLDFNPSFFSHPRAASGFTLSHADKGTRGFWVEHGKRCRDVAATIGKKQGGPCLNNLWIPDGAKDSPADRWAPRRRLKESLDAIYKKKINAGHIKDCVESKLFGLGSEAYVVGSHEFYMGYALSRGLMICFDMGHFHPTESVADKVSAMLQFQDELLLHMSRGVRWDSDHVVTLSDETKAVAEEVVRGDALGKVHLALDFFDASINRMGALVIGARAVLKAVLLALLQPRDKLREYERAGDNTCRLALMEETKALPFGAVWDYHCLKNSVPPAEEYIDVIRDYDSKTTMARS